MMSYPNPFVMVGWHHLGCPDADSPQGTLLLDIQELRHIEGCVTEDQIPDLLREHGYRLASEWKRVSYGSMAAAAPLDYDPEYRYEWVDSRADADAPVQPEPPEQPKKKKKKSRASEVSPPPPPPPGWGWQEFTVSPFWGRELATQSLYGRSTVRVFEVKEGLRVFLEFAGGLEKTVTYINPSTFADALGDRFPDLVLRVLEQLWQYQQLPWVRIVPEPSDQE